VDRNTGIAMVLIFGLLVAWMYLTMPTQEELERQALEQRRLDSLAYVEQTQNIPETPAQKPSRSIEPAREVPITEVGQFKSATADTHFTIVENDLYKAVFSNVGAGPVSFELKKYDTWDGNTVQLIADTSFSAYSLGFLTNDSYNVETRRLLFNQPGSLPRINVYEESQTLRYELPVGESVLAITYIFLPEVYEFDVQIEFNGIESQISGRSVDFVWKSKLANTEKSRVQEGRASAVAVHAGGEYR
jgi:YidC/Oxa1 family membrane protein insertase